MITRTVATATFIAVAWLAALSAAKADTIPPFQIYMNAWMNPNIGPGAGNTINAVVTDTGDHPSGQTSQHDNDNVTAALADDVTRPTVSTAVSTINGQYQLGAVASVTYYFKLQPPTPGGFNIGILADGVYDVSPSPGLSRGGTEADAVMTVSLCLNAGCTSTGSPLISMIVGPGAPNGPGTGVQTTFHLPFNVVTDATYAVLVSADAYSYYGPSAFSGPNPPIVNLHAMIDPLFSIDPLSVNDPQDYRFLFSPGVTNVAAAATPLPGSLPLFAGGLAGLAWLRARGRRRA